jgi:drug/metabolite transporter (DMT)-like permease
MPPPSNPLSQSLSHLRSQPLWLLLSIASGLCAALNGVFAKLTTTTSTTTLASSLTSLLSLPPENIYIEPLIRACFFGLNLLFNGFMWALFTAALAKGDSTTRVSIVNVSANFVLTALLGAGIFGERLPGLWWVGAALLAVGNVVIGRREEGERESLERVGRGGREREEGEGLMRGEEEEDLLELDERERDAGERERVRKAEDVDAPL